MKNEFVAFGLCLLMVSVVFSSGCIMPWETKTDFFSSKYRVHIFFSNSSNSQVEISIPFPTYTLTEEELNNRLVLEVGEGCVTYYKDNVYGNRIHLTANSSTIWRWGFDKKIVDTNFSGQKDNSIWVYLNKTDSNEKIYIFLAKESCWRTTKAFGFSREFHTDYVGLMSEPFFTGSAEWGSTDIYGKYVSINTSIELMDGWHKYPLTTGSYSEYAD